MLDEAANIAPLRKLDTYATTGAGMGIQFCSTWHNLAQVTSVYGKDKAATVINSDDAARDAHRTPRRSAPRREPTSAPTAPAVPPPDAGRGPSSTGRKNNGYG